MPKRKRPPNVAQDERDFFDSISRPRLRSYQQANQRRIQNTYRSPPSTLYHYTTPAGLLGIVENNKLWATHINYLNDATELGYARDLLRQPSRATSGRLVPPRASSCTEPATFDVSKTMDVFVSCFCEDGDLLSHGAGMPRLGRLFDRCGRGPIGQDR
jgi:hypothetical protein